MNILGLFKNPAITKNRKKMILIAGFIILFIGAIAVATYPFWPLIKYETSSKLIEIPGVPESEAVISQEALSTPSAENNGETVGGTLINDAEIKGNLLVIPKIGVKIPIVEGTTEAALNKGAWHLPETSTPDKGGNTAITGHRWKYRPPSGKTFYLLDKLVVGDTFKIYWQGKEYNYKVINSAIVKPTDVWVLNPTKKSTVTLITCTPLFSTKNRLVVKGQLI